MPHEVIFVMRDYRNMKPYKRLFLSILLGLVLGVPGVSDVQASDAIETAGDVLSYVLPATAAGMTLAHRDGKGLFQFGEAAAVTVGAAHGLKLTVDEKRPNGESSSFPSMHASISFSSAEFIRKRYGWEYGVPAYLTAMFVAYSRVESDEHYTHDVIAGALIGMVSSYIFTTPFNGLQIQPDASGKYWGMRLSYDW